MAWKFELLLQAEFVACCLCAIGSRGTSSARFLDRGPCQWVLRCDTTVFKSAHPAPVLPKALTVCWLDIRRDNAADESATCPARDGGLTD
ncbi:hypothetical protein DAEQUDRAFT_728448 [Daedalea quercina L-15889]|uniref:Secreted protein n=1 Tax=Daedalea quercina L-15889 TaxID=1314783 RepID=A0A165P9V0_9APHY|nr:hypothetical protein DAEQUDRAFT_728448 [Daedalea quercina L-15889]